MTTHLARTRQALQLLEQPAARALNAYLCDTSALALEGAALCDARAQLGMPPRALEGVHVSVKDNILVRGVPCTAGSLMLRDFVAPFTATAVERLQRAGAVVIGKTNLDEFGMGGTGLNSAYGPVHHPTRPGRVTGGSSSGAAASVAAGLCFAALGSDTGGSVRLPAAWCGVVGIKATYGRVSRHGLVSFASSFDSIGVLAASVDDGARVLGAVMGPDPLDSTSAGNAIPSLAREPTQQQQRAHGLRVGWPSDLEVEELDDATLQLWRSAADALAARGATIVPVRLPSVRVAVQAYYVLTCAEAASNLARYDGIRYGRAPSTDAWRARSASSSVSFVDYVSAARAQHLGPEVQRRIAVGNWLLGSGESAYEAYFVQAQRVRRRVCSEFEQAFAEVDVLLTPTAPTDAPLVRDAEKLTPVEHYLNDVMTVPPSLAGLPAMSLPFARDGRAGSVQLVGKWMREDVMLRAARALEP